MVECMRDRKFIHTERLCFDYFYGSFQLLSWDTVSTNQASQTHIHKSIHPPAWLHRFLSPLHGPVPCLLMWRNFWPFKREQLVASFMLLSMITPASYLVPLIFLNFLILLMFILLHLRKYCSINSNNPPVFKN